MTEMFGEAWSPMSVPDLAPDDDDDEKKGTMLTFGTLSLIKKNHFGFKMVFFFFFFSFSDALFKFRFQPGQ